MQLEYNTALEVLNLIFSALSHREQAIGIWLFIYIASLFFSKESRHSFGETIILIVTSWKVLLSLLMLCIWSVMSVILLHTQNLWDIHLLKDTILWFFTFAMFNMLFINDAKDNNFFRIRVKGLFKWTAVLIFVINFYTFRLWIELIIVPIFISLLLMRFISKTKARYSRVKEMLDNIIGFFLTGISVFVVYRLYSEYTLLFSWGTLKSFIMPIILSLLLVPFYYILALVAQYEILFVHISFRFRDKILKRRIYRAILLSVNFKLGGLEKIRKNLSVRKKEIYSTTNMLGLMNDMSK